MRIAFDGTAAAGPHGVGYYTEHLLYLAQTATNDG